MSDYVESWQQMVLDNAPKDETPDDVLRLMENEKFLNRGRWAAYVVRLGAANIRKMRYEMVKSNPMTKCEWHDGMLSVVLPEDPERIAVRMFDSRQAPARLYVPEAETRTLRAENAKLVDVLHEVEQEAVYAYRCLQQDCVTTANSVEHFFKKWWHAECELDRTREENAKLRELVRHMGACIQHLDRTDEDGGCVRCPYQTVEHDCGFEGRMLELGIEVRE